jgi:hypothetical protein
VADPCQYALEGSAVELLIVDNEYFGFLQDEFSAWRRGQEEFRTGSAGLQPSS